VTAVTAQAEVACESCPVFDEIPPRPAPPSYRMTMVGFSGFLACFLGGLLLDWFLWSGPMSLNRKIITGEYIVGSVIAVVFLSKAKSATPEANQKRMWALFLGMALVQVFIDVHQ
jgi:hypothetical protein